MMTKIKIVEALQGKNNKSVSVQFHPEFPTEVSGNADSSLKNGFQIIQGYRQLRSTESTKKLFRSEL
jgi:gamma-glutamyl-gamma-aminobutyrate hydrolase PuuD